MAAATTEGPEQVGILRAASFEEASVGGDHVCGNEVVAGEPEFAHQKSVATRESQSGDAGGAYESARGGETEGLGFEIKLSPVYAALGASGFAGWIDVDAAHRGEVKHDAAFADGEAGDGVAAAANRYGKRSADAALEGAHDVGDAGAACDARGVAVDHAVEDRSGCVVVWRCGVQGLAAHRGLKVFEICRGDTGLVWLCHVRYPSFFLC